MQNKFDKSLCGYSDLQLQELSKNRPSRNGLSVWATWESERTSFGRIFRKIAFFPSFLPLYISSDHYVDHLVSRRENEYNFHGKSYLTWNKKKSEIMQKNNINSFYVQHPFIFWKNKYYSHKILKSVDEKIGTIVFWPHSSEVVRVICNDFEKYFSELKKLPVDLHPITIFVSGQDLLLNDSEVQNQINYLERGPFKIDSFGNIASKNYVDKFYSVLIKTKLATSPMAGSQVFYTIDLGVPYWLIGDNHFKIYHKIENNFVEWSPQVDYPDSTDLDIYNWYFSELKKMSYTINPELLDFVRKNLGYDSELSRLRFVFIVWSSLFQNILKIIPHYLFILKKIYEKVTIFEK